MIDYIYFFLWGKWKKGKKCTKIKWSFAVIILNGFWSFIIDTIVVKINIFVKKKTGKLEHGKGT